ncbi:anaerobic benzoate catabolism transcriptional regulator [Kingella potus]|uniref:Anaerobic benzoate catabolism transcriptional regulator n=1 Tax=Kingella potus TaxID=265175 RepID=A0A377R2I4_9NEIS|nr:helix-turn-helix transcriptional regulator [Kingella potus]UOP00410.1 helix-turn-helix domain-containing protein [Kingella potus]STR02523.1 anaerobic benzoate catabolism transcriptional regulator [Kingella potus]
MAQLNAGDLDKLVGKRIQKRRKELALTADALAEKIGISQQQLSRYERGDNKVNINLLAQIADALDTPLNWFFLDACCPNAAPDGDDLKRRYDFHWHTFSQEQKYAVIRLLDAFSQQAKEPK